MQMVADRCL